MNNMPNEAQIREFLISDIIDKLVSNLIVHENFSLEKAMDMVYSSDTIKKLQNVEGELFVQSPDYVYELIKKEYRIDSDKIKDIVADPMSLY